MISCNHYDYIEIVCMYRYPILLTMKSGKTVEGVALDTQRNETGEECVKINTDDVECLVELDGIAKLKVCVDNPHIDEVSFI